MSRSTFSLMLTAVIGAPAWVAEVNALPSWVQVAWAAVILLTGATGLAFWAIDRR